MTALPPGMVLITDRKQAKHPLETIVGGALDAGFVAVMLREKDLEARELLEAATGLHDLCRDRGAVFLISERVDVALALPSAGAHMGRAGIPVADARRLLGDRLLGYSAHEVLEARKALDDGASYVTLSPVFSSRSKPGLEPRGLPFLRDGVAALTPGKVVALGGMEAGRLGEVRASGAHGAAVMGEMMRAENPSAAARELVAAWESGFPGLTRVDS